MTAPTGPGALGGAGPDTTIAALVEEALVEVRRRGREDLADRLVDAGARLRLATCTVLVIGEFNKGKSSLVNALLNARVCATDADTATAVPTLVRYGATLTAGLRTGPDDPLRPVPLDEVEATMARRWAAPTTVRAVEVALPRELLREGVVLVDTPGLGGGLSAAHAAATLRALAGADAVVFVTDASQELTATEVAFLTRAAQLCTQLLVAVAKTDYYPHWRRIVELDRGHLREAGQEPEIVALSAPLRHHGLRTGNRALTAESGYPVLAATLRRVREAIGRTHAVAAAAVSHSALTGLVAEIATEHDELADPAGHEGRVATWTAAKKSAEQLRGATAGWQQTLNDRIGDMASAVDLDLAVQLRAVRKETADRLAHVDPAKALADLEPWLYQRTNEAVADHLVLIRTEAAAVAESVAARFDAAAAGARAPVDVAGVLRDGTPAPSESGLATLAAAKASRMEMGLATVRGGSAGALAAHAVGPAGLGFVSAAFAWPVAAALAVILAGVLVGTTWKSGRANRQRALRAEADRAVAAYLEEVELRARTDTRDSVRRVQTYLRETYTAHAAELQATVARNLEVLARSVRDDELGSREHLARVAAELERMRALAERAERLVDERGNHVAATR